MKDEFAVTFQPSGITIRGGDSETVLLSLARREG